MQSGKKTIEIRLNDEKRRQLAVGDEIEFALASNEEERLLTRVESLGTFPSFKEAYRKSFHTRILMSRQVCINITQGWMKKSMEC